MKILRGLLRYLSIAVVVANLTSVAFASDLVGLIVSDRSYISTKMIEGMTSRSTELDLNLQTYPIYDGDINGQIVAIEDLIGKGAKGIVIVPIDAYAVVPPLKQAGQAGVYVVVVDSPISTGDTDTAEDVASSYFTRDDSVIVDILANNLGQPDGALCLVNGGEGSKRFEKIAALFKNEIETDNNQWKMQDNCKIANSGDVNQEISNLFNSDSSLGSILLINSSRNMLWRKSELGSGNEISLSISPAMIGERSAEILRALIDGRQVTRVNTLDLDFCKSNRCIMVPNFCSEDRCKNCACSECCPQ